MSVTEKALEQRVDQLEAELADLQEALQRLQREETEKRSRRFWSRFERIELGTWVDKVGIGLLLIGVLYFLKYSYDQGWFTEVARVGIGAAVGAAMLAAGFRAERTHRHLAAVLMGGATAVFYGVVYTSFAFYQFISFPVAFVLMQGVTLGGCWLAVRQHYSVLGCLAALGAFATPFALEPGAIGHEMLALYAVMVTLGLAVIYLLKGWRSLLVTVFSGAWVVLGLLSWRAPTPESMGALAIFVGSVLAVGAILVAAPVVRQRWKGAVLGEVETGQMLLAAVAAVVVLKELVAADLMLFSALVLCGAAVMFACSRLFPREEPAAKALLVTAAGFGAMVPMSLFGLNSVAQALLVVGVGANLLASEDNGRLRYLGVPAMGAVGLWSLVLLFSAAEGTPFLNPDGLQRLLAMVGLFVVGRSFEARHLQWIHYWAGLVAGLAALVHQLQLVGMGAMLATAIWGVVALGLLVVGMVREHRQLQVMGLVTIVATAAKLLLFDLHSVEVVWRMSLLIGFGATMLVLSAAVPKVQARREALSEEGSRL